MQQFRRSQSEMDYNFQQTAQLQIIRMQQKIDQPHEEVPISPPTVANLSIFSYTDETIHLYQLIMETTYLQKVKADQLEDDIVKFFNGLIWAEKKNPLLVYQMFEMKCCHAILEKYIDINPIVILKNSIILLGNCESGGLVAEQLIDQHYPHCLLTNILKPQLLNQHSEEIGQYIGNFMKCYHKLFKVEWLNKFILEGNYFQLLEINLKYYNCPDFMARTNALNIVLDLLRHPQVRDFISNSQQRHAFYDTIFRRMAKLFRNQLAQFGLRISHIHTQDNVDYIFSELEDKIALWLDISSNLQGMESLLQLSFLTEVILPLVIGPIETSIQMPLFSLKFSLFVVKKLMPIMEKLKILDPYIRMIFIEDKVLYQPGSLRKAFIEPFSLQKLLKKQISLEEVQQLVENTKVKSFYKNLFQSKDNHFILMINSLFLKLSQTAQTCPQVCKTYGFSCGGQFSIKLSHILLNQLRPPHQLLIVQSILHTLILINSSKSLSSEMQLQYISLFSHIISQLRSGLNGIKGSEKLSIDNMRDLAEAVEYDIGIVEKVQFIKEIYKIVFEWEADKQQNSSKKFYARVPDSPGEYLRYLFVKMMLLKKARTILLDNVKDKNLYESYYEHMLTQCPYIPDDLYDPAQIEQPLHTCQLLLPKSSVPAYVIQDNNFFVLGVPKSHKILITQGLPIKNVEIENPIHKRMHIILKGFDPDLQEVVQQQSIYMKKQDSIIEYINRRSRRCIVKNIEFVKECLRSLQSQIQKSEAPSLI